METRRIKNIAILILVFLNAFLLILLGYQDIQGRQVESNALEELRELFAAEDLALSQDVEPLGRALSSLVLTRNEAAEKEIAAFLLGDSAQMQSEGGGIFSYTSELGTVRFRSGGGFDSVRLMRPVEDAGAFMQQFCSKFGYRDLSGSAKKGSGAMTATQYAVKVPVYGCTVTLTFEDGNLIGASGAYIDLEDAGMGTGEHLSCMSALMRFFDYRREEGIVCSVIRDTSCVYQLQSTSGSPCLLPVWVVETDTYTYLVDAVSGEIVRK